ncbi:MAG: hypothetical protein EOP83_32885 [Verrucomicrobiaceae bacterium]|nr:MAG: hypothetical protein EOP83_32885 [Verrucomicrobiaceae bacterium]
MFIRLSDSDYRMAATAEVAGFHATYPYAFTPDNPLTEWQLWSDAIDWCGNHLDNSAWEISKYELLLVFRRESDAFAFRLRWC